MSRTLAGQSFTDMLDRIWEGEVILTLGLTSSKKNLRMRATWTQMDNYAKYPEDWWPENGAPLAQYIFEDFDEFSQWADRLNLDEETELTFISESDALRLNKEQKLWKKSPTNKSFEFRGLAYMLKLLKNPERNLYNTSYDSKSARTVPSKMLRQRLIIHGR